MLWVQELAVEGFRNLAPQLLSFSAGLNVLEGQNGQGKTNILEAIYFALTTKSFRTTRSRELVTHGAQRASARVRVGDPREPNAPPSVQSAVIGPRGKSVAINGNAPQTLAAYATRTPVVAFSPASLQLVTGASSERRRLLDRIVLFLLDANGAGVGYLRALADHRRALLQRRDALRTDPRMVGAFEAVLAKSSAAIVRARARAVPLLAEHAQNAFASVIGPHPQLHLRYRPGAPESVEDIALALVDSRVADQKAGGCQVGPHRDDIELLLDGHALRAVASQGQLRATTLALKLAEIALLARATGLRPVLLLDDVSSELDADRNAALLELVLPPDGQVILTTTDTKALPLPSCRLNYLVQSGRVQPIVAR